MVRRSLVFCAPALLALCTALALDSACLAASDVAAPTLYARALHVMDALPQPDFVAYTLESDSEGLQLDMWQDGRGQVWLRGRGGSVPQRWALRHRTFDYASEIVIAPDGRRFVSQRSFFDPTWYGAIRALRMGMFNSQDLSAPRTSPEERRAAGETKLRAIGAVSVMGPAIYRVEDRGDATCPHGEPGRALHLTSRDRDPMHQLTDVVIGTESSRFCVMRFAAYGAGGIIRTGFYEQHYADVGGYWLQTDGVLDGTWQTALLSGKHHGTWRYRLIDMTFPATLAPDIFTKS